VQFTENLSALVLTQDNKTVRGDRKMHHYEIQNYMKVLCEMTNKNLDEIVNNAYEFLPFFIMFNAQSCYIRYDTQDECITDVTLKVMNNAGLVIEVDPISSTITAFVAGEPGESLKMQKNTAAHMCGGVLLFVQVWHFTSLHIWLPLPLHSG
jgi:hypothetical protein